MPKQNLYLCQPKLQFDNGQGWKDAPIELIKDLLQVTVEESLHLPAIFTLVVHNSYIPATKERDEHKPWRHQKYFQIGGKIKLGFISSTTQDEHFKKEFDESLIEGEITAIEVNFNEKSEAPIVVRGYDISHRLHRGRYNRSFLNETDSDIVKKIAQEVGIKANKNVEKSGEPHEYVFQENQTNMEFLRERAARIGFELFIQGQELYFRKPQSQNSLKLKWLVDISSFSTRITSAEQVSAVEVRSWDYTQKRLISSTARSENLVTETGNEPGSSTSTEFDLKRKPPKMTVVDQPVFTAKQAEKMAQALCDELGGEFIYADAKAEGNPKIRPGRVVELKGMGDRFSGKYYITETRHFYNQRIYTTEFSVRGLRGGNLFTTLSPPVKLQPGQTFLVGIVTDNKDPKGWGRVKVKFPTLTEEHASHWARVVALGAANMRGFDCLPEVEDEVLVGFEHGDIHRPYVIGGVWNGKDAPPEKVDDTIQGGKVRLRTFKTRTGHTLQFVEEDKGGSKTGVRLETTGGHKIYLNDSDACIEIETKGGHKIKMDDRGKSISVNSTGNLSLKAQGNIEIKANGTITVNGAMIFLN
ncbi:VgrG-related protein [Pelatocladus sp. BLCC-F211]|uniref:VgrG-related protein n=1 Tax=Pelatocladus sp. BLCC-F211 TaxID=3342752 RepID=UPI0035BB2F17